MHSHHLTNFLLLVIAICLLSIAGNRFTAFFVPETKAAGTNSVEIGCYKATEESNCELRPIRVDQYGRLLINH